MNAIGYSIVYHLMQVHLYITLLGTVPTKTVSYYSTGKSVPSKEYKYSIVGYYMNTWV